METTPKAKGRQFRKPLQKRVKYIIEYAPHHAELIARAAALTGETLAGWIRRNSLEQAGKAVKSPELRQLALPRTGTEG